mmetsp:Transcript_29618/g.81472  ORF Transcript_29618/g.81472 Transcript_29618/m.81472 type:complete len:303 (-) Transcript_29618:125-1033(-)
MRIVVGKKSRRGLHCTLLLASITSITIWQCPRLLERRVPPPPAAVKPSAPAKLPALTEGQPVAGPEGDSGFSWRYLRTRAMAATAQGLVAAVVAAVLAAFEEPIMNRLLVERCTLARAFYTVRIADCCSFFLITCPTNMVKFPFFEVIHALLSFTTMTGALRGAVTGWLFCTCMLPFTNIRFRKSMNLPIDDCSMLYQAYPPTVLRDITYGWSRGSIEAWLFRRCQCFAGSFAGKVAILGLTVFLACIVSSPFNEWRGYWLQDPAKKLSLRQFFRVESYVRSTGITATLMGISLMVGMLVVP